MKQVGEVSLRRWIGFDGDLGTWGNFAHHLDGDKGDGIVAWSTVADVARPPPVRVFCMTTRVRRRSSGR